MSRSTKFIFLGISASFLILSACALPSFLVSSTATPSASTVEPTLAFVPTAAPPSQASRVLNICLGQEPNTLYINDHPNSAARSVLSAIYDGPVDSLDYTHQPVILQNIPSQAEGGVHLVPVSVKKGDWVINVIGEKIELIEGSRVYPAGCKEKSCIVTYKEDLPLNMEPMVVEFNFLPNLRWADGENLTADDSIYGFILAEASKNPDSEFLLSRTASYESNGDLTTIWRGLPGYRDNNYAENFWQPLPYHLWGEFSPDELVDADIAARFPIGWGAFLIDEWRPGERITLRKNTLYHRAKEGLPYIDLLNFYFIPDPNEAIIALVGGKCDILDPSISLDRQVPLLQKLENEGIITFYATEKISLESLFFGINLANYDDGIVSGNDRPRFLSDFRTRQAIASCLDRQKVVDDVFYGLANVPNTYIPNSHPLYTGNTNLYSFSPNEGSALLDKVGWRDLDNNPATPRTAFNVENIRVGTPLELDYITTTSIERRQVSEILAKSLRACGIGVNLHYLSPAEFYAPAPEGILFGRNFDLAQFAMGSESLVPRCDWFSSVSIPKSSNEWTGANLSGFDNATFDKACQSAFFALPDEPKFEQYYQETLQIFAEKLPAVPLYPYLSIAVSRPDLSGFLLNPSAKNPLWHIESFDTETLSIRKAPATPVFTQTPPTVEPSYPNSSEP